MTGLKIVYVPYKSGMAGSPTCCGSGAADDGGRIERAAARQDGRLRAYGVTTAERSSSMPRHSHHRRGGVPGMKPRSGSASSLPPAPRAISSTAPRDLLAPLRPRNEKTSRRTAPTWYGATRRGLRGVHPRRRGEVGEGGPGGGHKAGIDIKERSEDGDACVA